MDCGNLLSVTIEVNCKENYLVLTCQNKILIYSLQMKYTFIIQARLGSTRLPQKILLPFYEGKSILDLLIDKLKRVENVDIILATSKNSINDPLEAIAEKNYIKCFRGSENDVLQRFIDAAEFFGSSHIIRVCSDNPFIELRSINRLIEFATVNPQYDYISFNVNGIPSIKTHYGFWTEYVSLDALKKVASLTDVPLYHEHVTNYIYTHPEFFNYHLLNTSSILQDCEKVRLTIDTEMDFKSAQIVYKELCHANPYPTIERIIHFLDSNPSFYQTMEQEIFKNSK